jgi:hypothetical protein
MHPLTPSKLASLKLRAGPGAWSLQAQVFMASTFHQTHEITRGSKQASGTRSKLRPATITRLGSFLRSRWPAGTVTISEHLRSVLHAVNSRQGSPNHLDRARKSFTQLSLKARANGGGNPEVLLHPSFGRSMECCLCKRTEPGERAPRVRTSPRPARPHASSGTSPRVVTVTTAEQ